MLDIESTCPECLADILHLAPIVAKKRGPCKKKSLNESAFLIYCKMSKAIYTFLLLLYFQLSSGQNIKTSDLPGKWIFNKYTETINSKPVERMQVDRTDTYIFSANGTYQNSSKSGKEVFVSKGKWKVTDGGLKVRLYNNVDVPDDPNTEIADHDLIVQYLNGKFYLTYTSGDVLNGPRTDYYKKSK